MNIQNLALIDAVILCGGLGTRLKEITQNVPKPMIDIKGQPFLNIIIKYLASFGIRRIILCTGYKSDVIENYYKSNAMGLEIIFSEEKEPSGTAGAIKNAQKSIKSNNFLALNGDSFCEINLADFFEFHKTKKALISILLTSAQNTDEVGFAHVDNSQRVVNFSEKQQKSSNGYVNAGIYFFDKHIFSYIPDTIPFSLEYDFFPKMMNREIYGYVIGDKFFDIGTPERYKAAKRHILINREIN